MPYPPSEVGVANKIEVDILMPTAHILLKKLEDRMSMPHERAAKVWKTY